MFATEITISVSMPQHVNSWIGKSTILVKGGDVLLGLSDSGILIIFLILKFSLNLAFTKLKRQSKMIRCVL
jgi:hypothetical protein